MPSSSTKNIISLTRSVSGIIYVVDIIVATLYFFSQLDYIHLLLSSLVYLISLVMLCVSIRKPQTLFRRFKIGHTDFLFTFRGRYMMDIILSFILFAMDGLGIIAGAMTIGLILCIRLVGIAHPKAFQTLFDIEENLNVVLDVDTIVSGNDDTTLGNTTAENAYVDVEQASPRGVGR